MGLLFGSAHQLPMVGYPLFAQGHAKPMKILGFALHFLAEYPEYMEPLREEAVAAKNDKTAAIDYDQMQLMDSFLKETARLNPTLIG